MAREPAPGEDLPLPDDAQPDPLRRYGRIALLVFLALWGSRLAATDYHGGALGESFMHVIVLPIHEAGHVFFRPFGEFMMFLGGSLFQVAFPLGVAVAFVVKQRDPFGAAVCVWWAGASLVDLSPYVWDALDPQLVLLGGATGAEGGHDWVYLLGRTHARSHAHGLGATVHFLGVLAMIAGVAWGVRSLRSRPHGGPDTGPRLE